MLATSTQRIRPCSLSFETAIPTTRQNLYFCLQGARSGIAGGPHPASGGGEGAHAIPVAKRDRVLLRLQRVRAAGAGRRRSLGRGGRGGR